MTMANIGKWANDLGIEPGRMAKSELIRAIQQAKGNVECFGQLGSGCPNRGCCFRRDCMKERSVKEELSCLVLIRSI